MKELYIISSWPNVKYKEDLLLKIIRQLKSLNKEILLASHYLIPDYITSEVDYYIYDKKNQLNSHKDLTTATYDYYFDTDNFRLEGINISHAVALMRLFNISLNFAKNLGYTHFTFMESDTDYELHHIEKIVSFQKQTTDAGKKLFFFKLRPYEFPFWENNGMFEVLETHMFGGQIDEFLRRLDMPTDVSEWNTLLHHDIRYDLLEYRVTQRFLPYKKDYLILDSMQHTFADTKVNISTTGVSDGVYYNEKSDSFILCLYNGSNKKRTYKLNGTILLPTGRLHSKIELNPNTWWINGIDTTNTEDFSIAVFEDGIHTSQTYYLLDKTALGNIKNRKRIIFKG